MCTYTRFLERLFSRVSCNLINSVFVGAHFQHFIISRSSSDPKKRFELFVKATQLEVITEKLNSCCHDYDIVKTKYEEHKNASEETQMKLKEAEKKFRLMKSMDKMKVSSYIS